MNPVARELRPLLSSLEGWIPTIRRSTYSDNVTVSLVDEGIQVVVSWSYKGGGEWRHLFTNEELLGHTSTLRPPSTWMGHRRMCGLSRQIIYSVLSQRGA